MEWDKLILINHLDISGVKIDETAQHSEYSKFIVTQALPFHRLVLLLKSSLNRKAHLHPSALTETEV